MLHRAEKSLSSIHLWVTRILIHFLCCSTHICKSSCQLIWQIDCELLFPIPPGIFLASKQLDEICILLFLLSSLGYTISQQQLYNLFVYIFENVAFEKTRKNELQMRRRRHLKKLLRRRCARFARERKIAKTRLSILTQWQKLFDSTLGYPGEGWEFLKMATWNTRSLTFERFKYCEQLGYDVLAITELWRKQNNYQTKCTRYTTSTPRIIQKGPNKGKPRFPSDKAAGVGILLSTRMQKKLMGFGSEGERVCWVRLKGPTCNIFVVAVYATQR